MGSMTDCFDSMTDNEQRKDFVCHKCVIDHSIKLFIKNNASENFCCYCDSREKSVDFFTFISFLKESINYFYANALDEMGVFDGIYPGKTYDTHDLLIDEIGNITKNAGLISSIVEALPQYAWCKKDPQHLQLEEGTMLSWKIFCDLVKHKMRYTFFNSTDNINYSDYIENNMASSNEILSVLSNYFSHTNIIKTLKINTALYRARNVDGNSYYSKAIDLGPPPPESASNNRMSPSGIPMFYATTDEKTALNEIKTTSGTVAKFNLMRDIKIIDLSSTLPEPSIFDHKKRDSIGIHKFLNHYSLAISTKIDDIKDVNIHLEYIPTQILTEYIRYLHPHKIQGIKYRSSRGPGACYVLFIDNEDIVKSDEADEDKLLKLISCNFYWEFI